MNSGDGERGRVVPFGSVGANASGLNGAQGAPQGGDRGAGSGSELIQGLAKRFFPDVARHLPPQNAYGMQRGEIAREVKQALSDLNDPALIELNLLDHRDLVTALINAVLAAAAAFAPPTQPAPTPPAADAATPADAAASQQAAAGAAPQSGILIRPQQPPPPPRSSANRASVEAAKVRIQGPLLERIDVSAAARLPRQELARDLTPLIEELLTEQKIQLNAPERAELVERVLDDMLGLGPLEPLLADDGITDIMVNGPKQVYVERRGRLELSEAQFRDNAHVMAVATRIVAAVGRRVDESSPLCDARLADGSRVNIIIPPLAIDGPSISIRKFAKKKITLEVMERQENMSTAMATLLRIAGRCRLNILISGGTGSGKTTLLNAISQMIDPGERVVTIEDAAELQLQQPHVVRLETRHANLEGQGEITMRDLVKNALRMRPDRIILGEIRGAEALDMLQAMNTGHDGSLATIHANRPREALTRLENMVGMTGINLPAKAVRTQIASAVNLIVQISRMRDGVRRITYISEVVGMEGDIVTMQDLFWYEFRGEGPGGRLVGDYKSAGIRPAFSERAAYFGLDKVLLEAV